MSIRVITVVAVFIAKPGKEAALREALTALLAPTREEPGCLNYDLHVALDNKGQFLFYENWISKAHLDTHLANSHIQSLIPKLDFLCKVTPELKLYEKIV